MVMYVDNKASSKHPVVLTARLDPDLSRWQWLVKWFLAIPHYFLLAFLWPAFLVVTAIMLLVTGKYPPQLFALIVGGNRWIYRVIAYAGLMTDQYPPFRLDQGGTEPTLPPLPPTAGPAVPPVPEPAGTWTGA